MRKVHGTNILAKELNNKTLDSGLVVPDTAASERSRFVVIAVGGDVEYIKPDDVVYVSPLVGRTRPDIVIDGDELTILNESIVIVSERK